MEKKVESQRSEYDDKPAVDSKSLVALFQLMSVTGEKQRCNASMSSSKNSILKKGRCGRRRKKVEGKKVTLKPSKLTQAVKDATRGIASEARFSEFSADCARELESIEKNGTPPTSSSAPEDQSRAHKKRKATSSCAQQARNECFNSDLNFDIDLLTDYLEETILLPKKMSYMAELMYT